MSAIETKEVARAEDGLRVDRWFKRHYPELNHGRLEKLLRTGQIRIDGLRVKSGDRLKPGQIIRLPPISKESARPPRDSAPISDRDAAFMRGLIIHKALGFFILNKPPGLAVQGGSKTVRHIDGLLPALASKGEDRPRLVHRLDRDTSGALVIARSAQSAAELSRLFRTKSVTKVYWALVEGVPHPKSGRIDLALAKGGPRGEQRMEPQDEDDDEDDGKRAITVYEVVSQASREFAWVALMPVTGRTHQLRAHMAAIGHPIVGDVKYGSGREPGGEIPEGLHLHARQITLPGEGRRTVTAQAPLPPHMAQTWKLFGFEESEAREALAGL